MIHVTDRLPNNGQYVLAHLTLDNWRDDDDPEGNRYWKVVKLVCGMSMTERDALPSDSSRKLLFTRGDQFGNNQVPYRWTTFGSSEYFGQDVDWWCELPVIS